MLNESLAQFFNSATGQILSTIISFILFFSIIGILYKRKNFSIKSITFMSISISLSIILSYITLFSYPTGGSITAFSMFFITIIGYVFGPLLGILSGITYGLLSFALKPQFYYPMQVIIDYILASAMLGLSGFFVGKKYSLQTGYIVACSARMIMHILSGGLYFGMYAPEGMNPWIYSITYNASYIISEIIITLIIISLPPVKMAINQVKATALK